MKIFHNANIYAPDHPSATGFAIDNGNFIALGSDADILNASSDADQIINLEGKTIWPGLTDAHVHLRHLAESMAMVDCETDSLEECLANIKKALADTHNGAWLRGHGWNQNRWESGYGSAEILDSVCGEHPAYLTAKSLHAGWANSKALQLAGIDAQTSDPPGGVIQRDREGKPTGILFEAGAMAMVESVIPKPTSSELTAKISALMPELIKLGLVAVHDFDGLDCWNALQSIHESGDLQIRIRKNIPFDQLEAFIQAGNHTNEGDNWLHLGAVKLFADGALGPQTAAMNQPYQGSQETGTLLLTETEILEIGKHAVNHGIGLSVHAIGDLANHVVLNAIDELRQFERIHNLPHFEHRIEHVQIIDPRDLPRLAALDVVASVQPVHAPSDYIMADKYLGNRARFAYAYQSMIQSGAKVVLGSDAPVEPVNPFYGIHAAVTRRRLDGAPGPQGWQPQERLSLEQALMGFSLTPAKIAQRGNRMGKIAPGFKADFLVLNEDPFLLAPHALQNIQPLATFINGTCMFQSPKAQLDLGCW